MIIVSGLQKSFGSRVLLRDGELRVGARDRLAVVGPNGSGKTTLLEMIAGLQHPDAGAIDIARDVVLGYLPQETDALRGRSILAEVLSAGAAMSKAGHRLQVLQTELDEVTDQQERARLLDEYARLQERFEALGGWTVEVEARRILSGLGFRDSDLERRTESLSGGWLMRVALAKLLLAAPDCLLLDEPTNHLDLDSVSWLERFLRTYEGAVLLISHDRDFMNATVTKVVEIEDTRLVSYTGDYESFTEQRALRLEQAVAAARNQSRKIAHQEAFINRFRYKASKARQVQSRIKMLDRMERVEVPVERRKAMKIGFPQPPRSGRAVVELEGLHFAYRDTPVYRGLDLVIERGQKAALVGPNGAGKTTLLKLVAGVLTPQQGERRLGHNVTLGYFAQHQIEALDPSSRVIEELERAVPPGVTVRARDLLGRFLFSGDDVEKRVSVLSGGERTRLALAKLLVTPCNILCLDEPTNHLDVQSRDVLEDALTDYQGAIVLITHDRHLIRSIANRIVEVDAGRVRTFDGDYESYLYRMRREAEPVAPATPTRPARDAPSPKERRRAAAAERARLQTQRSRLRRVEADLEAAHAEAGRLEALLADADFYVRAEDVHGTIRAFEEAKRRLVELEAEWDRLTEELNALEAQ